MNLYAQTFAKRARSRHFTAGIAVHIQARMNRFDDIEAHVSTDPAKTVVARKFEQGTTNSLMLFDVKWNDYFEFTLTAHSI